MARDEFVSDIDPAGTALLFALGMIFASFLLTFAFGSRRQNEKERRRSFGSRIRASLSEYVLDKNRRSSSSNSASSKSWQDRWADASTSIDAAKASLWEIVTNTGHALEESRRKFAHEALVRGFSYKFLSFEYLARLTVVTVFFAVASYLNSLAAVIAGYRTPNVQMLDARGYKIDSKTLPDIGHDLLALVEARTGSLQELLDPDTFINLTGQLTVAFILAHPKRLQILRRLFAIFGYVNICRMVCVLTTSLPDSAPRCVAQFTNSDGDYKLKPMFPKVFSRALHLTLKPSEVVTCGDMIFSGHTVFLILCYKTMTQYCSIKECNTPLMRWLPVYTCQLIRMVSAAITLTGLFAILATRLHYTLDVIIAVYITRHAWGLYHRWTYQIAHNDAAHLEGVFGWETLFRWLEAEVVNTVDADAYWNATISPRLQPYEPTADAKKKRVNSAPPPNSGEIEMVLPPTATNGGKNELLTRRSRRLRQASQSPKKQRRKSGSPTRR